MPNRLDTAHRGEMCDVRGAWHHRAMPSTWTLGAVTVFALQDAVGPFFQPRQDAFPDATPEHWARADEFDPGAVSVDGRWLLRFRCFAMRLGDGRVILVDAGIGPVGSPASGWAPVPGQLPDELAAAGLTREEVDTVVLTHLHTDHVGWAVAETAPYFPNARYLLQRAELSAIDAINPALREALIAPLRATDQLSLVDGDASLAPGLRVIATPGHTPGHQSVLLEARDETLALTGDLLVHAVQLVDPDLAYAHEVDGAAARESRTALLRELAARGAALATAHLTEPFVRLNPSGSAPARPR